MYDKFNRGGLEMDAKKIAIISDIKANKYALKAFLDYIENDEEIKYVLNLGNFIQRGPNPCEVFDTIVKDKRFINIMGEYEYNLCFSDIDSGTYEIGDDISQNKWTKDRIGQERLKRIRALPKYIDLEINNKKILMVHAKHSHTLISEFNIMVTLFGKGNSIEALERGFLYNHDYIFYYHSRARELFTDNAFWRKDPITILNPGAICCLKDDLISFAIVDFNGSEPEIAFKAIPFERDMLINDVFKYDVPLKTAIFLDCYGIESVEKILEANEVLRKYAQDKGNIYLEMSKGEEACNPVFREGFWKKLLTWAAKNNKYISFGCWHTEESIIKEVKEKLNCIRIEKTDTKQVYYFGEINDNVYQLVTRDFMNDKTLKWFDLYFYKNLEESSISVGLNHCGKEMQMLDLNKDEVKFIKSIIDYDEMFYRN